MATPSSRDLIAEAHRQARRMGIPPTSVVLHRDGPTGITYHTASGSWPPGTGRVQPAASYEVDENGRAWGGPFLTDPISITDTAQEAPKMDRLEVIEARLAELEKEATALRAIPDLRAEPDETTLSYERSYTGGDPFGKWFVFVAVKMAGMWHTSGAQGGERLDDDALRALLASANVRNVFRATAWEAVAKVVEKEATGDVEA